jgi:two-component system nitrate/nitrite response regulator NarL
VRPKLDTETGGSLDVKITVSFRRLQSSLRWQQAMCRVVLRAGGHSAKRAMLREYTCVQYAEIVPGSAHLPKHVIVADAHPIASIGLMHLLAGEAAFRVVGHCANGVECLNLIRELTPHIAVIDVELPAMNGFEILGAVRAEKLPTKVVFLASSMRRSEMVAAFERGAKGVIFKDEDPDRILDALREVAAGQMWSDELIELFFPGERSKRRNPRKTTATLSQRERGVMQMVALGLQNKAIGERLNIREGTVKNHLHHIYRRLRISNRSALIRLAAPNRR